MKQRAEIGILGGGESGTGAAILAEKKGYRVMVSDNGPIKEKYKSVLIKYAIDFEEKGHSEDRILRCSEVIKSPGIPETAPLVRHLRKKGIPVISEIEFAGRHTDAKKICITGSNGKTTTTLLTHHILKKAGLDAGLAGNVGTSFARQVAEKNHEIYVLELSSFQLDGMVDFKADIAVLLNITPDHLDRYGYDFKRYILSKFRILQNMTERDAFIYNADDSAIAETLKEKRVHAGLYPISLQDRQYEKGAFLRKNEIIIHNDKNQLTMTLEELALQGRHNVYNSMAAGIAARLMDIRKETIKKSLSDFHNIPHRLEYVASVYGINFLNDSKATNVNSTWYALEYVENPMVWIAGGIDKGNDYSIIKKLVKKKVKAIVCLGVDNEKIHREFSRVVPVITDTKSAEEAVLAAYHLADKGDTVLLSPACASFDLFESYEDRGNQFKNAVNRL
jgi:UDP-N-acetylmuramoylalanine--D-glutamate ligase